MDRNRDGKGKFVCFAKWLVFWKEYMCSLHKIKFTLKGYVHCIIMYSSSSYSKPVFVKFLSWLIIICLFSNILQSILNKCIFWHESGDFFVQMVKFPASTQVQDVLWILKPCWMTGIKHCSKTRNNVDPVGSAISGLLTSDLAAEIISWSCFSFPKMIFCAFSLAKMVYCQ